MSLNWWKEKNVSGRLEGLAIGKRNSFKRLWKKDWSFKAKELRKYAKAKLIS